MTINSAINGGTISVEDCIKHSGYPDPQFAPTRKVRVELLFTVPEGQDGKAYMEGVSRAASTKVDELLKKQVVATATETVTEAPKAEPAKVEKPKKATKEKSPAEPVKERTKDDLAREAGLPVSGKSDDELLEDEPTIAANGKVVAEEDDLGDLLGEAAPPPVTDLELGKAAQEKNAKMKAELGEAWAPAKIRELISKYSDGKRINDIPAAKRPQFMKELAALK